ncbi:hypothetical protein D3C75_1140030 [compost metagenome]
MTARHPGRDLQLHAAAVRQRNLGFAAEHGLPRRNLHCAVQISGVRFVNVMRQQMQGDQQITALHRPIPAAAGNPDNRPFSGTRRNADVHIPAAHLNPDAAAFVCLLQ